MSRSSWQRPRSTFASSSCRSRRCWRSWPHWTAGKRRLALWTGQGPRTRSSSPAQAAGLTRVAGAAATTMATSLSHGQARAATHVRRPAGSVTVVAVAGLAPTPPLHQTVAALTPPSMSSSGGTGSGRLRHRAAAPHLPPALPTPRHAAHPTLAAPAARSVRHALHQVAAGPIVQSACTAACLLAQQPLSSFTLCTQEEQADPGPPPGPRPVSAIEQDVAQGHQAVRLLRALGGAHHRGGTMTAQAESRRMHGEGATSRMRGARRRAGPSSRLSTQVAVALPAPPPLWTAPRPRAGRCRRSSASSASTCRAGAARRQMQASPDTPRPCHKLAAVVVGKVAVLLPLLQLLPHPLLASLTTLVQTLQT
mmetsp:Transcript_24501/g.53531  ORF Transcript_24501/g.53531 Transcript_24501/m.53531 type:complete len:366 (+) Transcript_24501:648-1745(+)